MQLEIATGFYQSDSIPLSGQRCVNWEPVIPQAAALNKRALFDPRGIKTLTTTGATITGINRGAEVVKQVPYFITGQSLYSMDSDFVVTNHGTVFGNTRVSLAKNDDFLVIVVPGERAYTFDTTTSTLAEITDTDFIVSDDVAFKDGFFTFTATDGSVFFISSLNDPTTYDALDFASAEVRPDDINSVHVNRNELFIGGEETIERFQNIGGADFPFQRIEGGDLQKGVHAKHTLKDFDNSFVFVGGAVNELSSIWRVGGGVQKISTSAIDNAIQEYTQDEISDAFAFTYAYGGNFFVAFTFTSTAIPSRTFVYNATTSALSGQHEWHERQTGTSVAPEKWRVTEIVSAYGELIVFDSVDGRIGTLDKDTHQDYGEAIKRQKTSMPYQVDLLPLFVSQLVLTMESGVGTIDGLDPQIHLEYSDKGGREGTFESSGLVSYGEIGEYQTQATWRRQGQVLKNRVLRFTTTEPVKSTLIRLDAEASAGQKIL